MIMNIWKNSLSLICISSWVKISTLTLCLSMSQCWKTKYFVEKPTLSKTLCQCSCMTLLVNNTFDLICEASLWKEMILLLKCIYKERCKIGRKEYFKSITNIKFNFETVIVSCKLLTDLCVCDIFGLYLDYHILRIIFRIKITGVHIFNE